MTEWLERNGFIPIPTQSLTDDEIKVLKSILGEPLEERAMRLIDADALMRTLGITDTDCGKCDLHGAMGCSKRGDFVDACIAIEHAPTIEKRKSGKWIDMGDFEQCSVCTWTHLKEVNTVYGTAIWIKSAYCPNCGADMRGGDDE